MKITLLVDNPNSWIVPYARRLTKLLKKRGHEVALYHNSSEIKSGECAFFLSCEKIVPKHILSLNTHNLVIHESALPKGRGWSPLTWQILEGKKDIPITLLEAAEEVDSGPIYLQDYMHFEGHELIGELRDVQGNKTIDLILKFIDSYPMTKGHKQKGKGSFYPRRTPKDSELDVNKSLSELFDKLRIVDNDRYPAYFIYKNQKYILKISKEKK